MNKTEKTLALTLIAHDESRFVEKAMGEDGVSIKEMRPAPSIRVIHVKTPGGFVFSSVVDGEVYDRILSELYPEIASDLFGGKPG